MILIRRLLCLTLAVNLALLGVPLPTAMAQQDPGPGDQTTPAPTDPEKTPAPAEGETPAAPPAPEGAAPPAPEAEQTGIKGQLLDLDGTTPIPNEEVRVSDKEGRQIASAISGVDGKFTLPVLADGSYVLETRGVRQPFEVKPDQPIRELKILVPAAAFRPAGPAQTKDDDDNDTVLIFVGVGIAVVVAGLAVGLGVGLSGGDGKDKVIGPFSNEPPTVLAVPNNGVPTPARPPLAFAIGTTGEMGTVHLGAQPTRFVEIQNATSVTQIFTGNVSGAGFSLLLPNGTTATTQSITVPPQSNAVFQVLFNASMVGDFNGSLTISVSPGAGTAERALAESNMLMLGLHCRVIAGGQASPSGM